MAARPLGTRATVPGGATDSLTLRQLQEVELEILRELGRRCEAASLRWFVLGGTLLGAVRHGGFIPWDDDIDVGMPRPDFERFEALCRRSVDPRFAWESSGTNSAYPFLYGKLIRSGTVVVEAALADLPIRHAVSIDVFPIDGAPDSRVGRRLQALAFKLAATTLGARIRRTGLHRVLALGFRLVPRSLAIALVRRLARRDPYDASSRVVNAGGAWGYQRECHPRGRIEPVARLGFEGMAVPAPGRWHDYLTQVYGDYARLPAPGERRARHALEVVSLGATMDPAAPASPAEA